MSTLLLVGATGLVGTAVRQQAEDNPRVRRLISLTRRPIEDTDKQTHHVVDFDNLPDDADWWAVDSVICALGTTRARAGSRRACRHVDHDLPLAIARQARRHGILSFVLTSALGASMRSPLGYFRTKGELEEDLRRCRFPSLTLVRPGLILGSRDDPRPLERLGIHVSGKVRRILPPHWRPVPARHIADELLDAAMLARPGVHVRHADQIPYYSEA